MAPRVGGAHRRRARVAVVALVALLGGCSSGSDGGANTDTTDTAMGGLHLSAKTPIRAVVSVEGSEPQVRDVEVAGGKRVRYRFPLRDGLGYDVLVPDDVARRMDSASVHEERNFDTEEESPG